jgi:hypothetical protein
MSYANISSVSRPVTGLALNELHDGVRATVVGSEVKNRDDLGVIEGRPLAGLTLKSSLEPRVGRQDRREDLDRH